jgi:hypothetical protein
MSRTIPPLPNTPSWRGAQLKHRDKFTFYFTFMAWGECDLLTYVNKVMTWRFELRGRGFEHRTKEGRKEENKDRRKERNGKS